MNRIKDFKNFRLYEFEEVKDMPNAEQITFMDNLYQEIKKEIMPNIPEQFKVTYDRGKMIEIKTDNKQDLSVGVKLRGDILTVFGSPIDKPMYDYNYTFNMVSIDNIINTLLYDFNNSETKGLYTGKSVKDVDDEKEVDDEEEIDIPISKKSKKIKKSIDIKVIKNVLEDAYILDDIDLKDTSVAELIRRMLVESRSKNL